MIIKFGKQFVRIFNCHKKVIKTSAPLNDLSEHLGMDNIIGLSDKSPFDGTIRGELKNYLIEDNFPNVALEAQAIGLPVLAFNTGGIPEIVSNGFSGMVLKRFNAQTLLQGLSEMLNAGLVGQSFQIADETKRKFNQENSMNKYRKLYEGLCDAD